MNFAELPGYILKIRNLPSANREKQENVKSVTPLDKRGCSGVVRAREQPPRTVKRLSVRVLYEQKECREDEWRPH